MQNKSTFDEGRRKGIIRGSPPPELMMPGDTPLPCSGRFRRNFYWTLVALASAFILSLQPVHANIWDTFSYVMKDIYGRLLGISTIIAVTAATVALLVRMISRNQRAVDEATSWLKRVLVTWLILNTLGFVIAYLQPMISGGQYIP